jgi:hypothetical protein
VPQEHPQAESDDAWPSVLERPPSSSRSLIPTHSSSSFLRSPLRRLLRTFRCAPECAMVAPAVPEYVFVFPSLSVPLEAAVQLHRSAIALQRLMFPDCLQDLRGRGPTCCRRCAHRITTKSEGIGSPGSGLLDQAAKDRFNSSGEYTMTILANGCNEAIRRPSVANNPLFLLRLEFTTMSPELMPRPPPV